MNHALCLAALVPAARRPRTAWGVWSTGRGTFKRTLRPPRHCWARPQRGGRRVALSRKEGQEERQAGIGGGTSCCRGGTEHGDELALQNAGSELEHHGDESLLWLEALFPRQHSVQSERNPSDPVHVDGSAVEEPIRLDPVDAQESIPHARSLDTL